MYRLDLTENDIKTIAFVGHRYCWSDALRDLHVGVNEIPQAEAWIAQAFFEDTEGNHSPFPMLANGELMAKLIEFWNEIV